MTIINGMLREKKLVLEKVSPNQGEAGNVELIIDLEPYENVKYYLEFLCPYGRKYTSKEIAVNNGKLNYLMPSCIFLVAGRVYIQIIGRQEGNIIIKSNKSENASIEILPSINGIEHIAEHQDFISYAEALIANAGDAATLAEQRASLAEQKAAAAQALVDTIQQKLNNGELNGKNAYSYALEKGFEGTEAEFCEKLSKVGQIIEDAPDNKNYLRKKNKWEETAEIPLPNTQSVGKVLTVVEDDEGVKYTLMPIEENVATLEVDSTELEAIARDSHNVFRCRKILSADTNLNGLQGRFEISYIFEGQIVIQNITDNAKSIIYRRTKFSRENYGEVNVMLIKPLCIENFTIEPSDFFKVLSYYQAKLNLNEYVGYNLAGNTLPMLTLAKADQMKAYECNLSRDLELNCGILTLTASFPPPDSLHGNLVLMGVF